MLYLLTLFTVHIVGASILHPEAVYVETVPLSNPGHLAKFNASIPVQILQVNPCAGDVPFIPDIVPLLYYSGCDYDVFFAPVIRAGYTVILYTQGTTQQAGWFTSSQRVIDSLEVPIYEISGIYLNLFHDNSSIWIEPASNPYDEIFRSAWFMSLNVIIGFCSLVGLVLSVFKFGVYCRYRTFNLRSLPHINTLTLICYFGFECAYMIDPTYAHRLYNFFESGIIVTISIPLLMCSCCFTALFWLQVVNRVMTSNLWRGKYYIICVSISVGITVITILLGGLASGMIITAFAALIIILAFFLGMSITYIVAGIKVLQAIRRTKDIKQTRARSGMYIAIGFVLCSACSLGYFATGILNMSNPLTYKPPYSIIVSGLLMQFFGILHGLFQIIFLKTPKSDKTSDPSSTSLRTRRLASNKQVL